MVEGGVGVLVDNEVCLEEDEGVGVGVGVGVTTEMVPGLIRYVVSNSISSTASPPPIDGSVVVCVSVKVGMHSEPPVKMGVGKKLLPKVMAG
jgi:hypothetical protein